MTTSVEHDDDQPLALQVSAVFGNFTLNYDSADTFFGPKCQYCCDNAYFLYQHKNIVPNCQHHLQQDPIQSNSNEGIYVVPAIISGHILQAHPSNGAGG